MHLRRFGSAASSTAAAAVVEPLEVLLAAVGLQLGRQQCLIVWCADLMLMLAHNLLLFLIGPRDNHLFLILPVCT